MIQEVLQAILQVVAPVFLVAGVGFVYAGRRELPIAAFTDLIIHLTAACLVFDALTRAERFEVSALRAPASATGLILGGLLVGAVARRLVPSLRALPMGAAMLPVAFMNAGNLGLPLMKLAFGDPGFELAMLFFVTFSVLQSSVGIAIVKGKGGVAEVFRLPLVYAAVAGVAVNQMQWSLPTVLSVPVHMLGQTVIPMMLLSLGGRMRALVSRSSAERPPLGPVLLLPALRIGAGFAVGLLVNLALGNEGLIAQVTLVVSMLPPAVISFALVEKYGEDPRASAAVSAAIAAGTALAVVVLPIALALLRRGQP